MFDGEDAVFTLNKITAVARRGIRRFEPKLEPVQVLSAKDDLASLERPEAHLDGFPRVDAHPPKNNITRDGVLEFHPLQYSQKEEMGTVPIFRNRDCPHFSSFMLEWSL